MENRQGINGMVVSDYHSKGTEFSASDFTRPNYQLWVSKNHPKNEDEDQGFKAWVGQLIHDASYNHAEVDVVKEFSFIYNVDLDAEVGGSVDRCSYSNGKWTIEDLKSMGNFPAQKAYEHGKHEWITQLSIYRVGMESRGFDMSHDGVIHQYVMGYQKKKGSTMQEYNKIDIELLTTDETVQMMRDKIDMSRNKIAPMFDCMKYMCADYCSYNKACPSYKGE